MTAVYSAAHFLVDFACAYLMFRYVKDSRARPDALLVYNFCAFALQMPFGVLTDMSGNGHAYSAAGCILVGASALLGNFPLALSAVAGTGNALFHIGGGHDVLLNSEGSAGRLGVFVSPGAFGLFLGGLISGNAALKIPVIAAMAIAATGIMHFCPNVQVSADNISVKASAGSDAPKRNIAGGKAPLLALALLFTAVCLRSYGGFLFSFGWKSGAWSWIFALSVVFGKTLGGFIYDRVGGVKASAFTLTAGALMFMFSDFAPLGCTAVLLFNMSMPLTLRAAADILPRRQGFSFGLLTFALFIGFLPTWLGLPSPGANWVYAALCLVTLALILPVFVRKRP